MKDVGMFANRKGGKSKAIRRGEPKTGLLRPLPLPLPERVRFESGKCGMMCETEVACVNHERFCAWRRV